MQIVQVNSLADVRELARLRWEWESDTHANDELPGAVAENFADYVTRFEQWWEGVSNYTVGFLAIDASYQGSRAAGMVIARIMTRPPSPDVKQRRANAYINSMYVGPEYRNTGVGTLLVAGADEYLASVGVTRTILHPRVRAIPFYQRAGYSTALNLMSKET